MTDTCLAQDTSIMETIMEIVGNINPYDELEKSHIRDTLAWMQSTNEIFRIKKPDVPNKHLVSYSVLFEPHAHKMLLVDHINAQRWLPSGGHVDPGEHPRITAERECFEELGIKADFLFEEPIFITTTPTTGLTAGHTDVSLWYILRGDHLQSYDYDKSEFNGIKWFALDEIPFHNSDPNMQRFVAKLKGLIS